MPGHYHKQPYAFQSPLEALSYIRRHSEVAMDRSLNPDATQLRLVPGDPPLLMCNREPLESGARVTALFPDGWHYIRLELTGQDGGSPEWTISTPEYAEYSPVGLFVRL